MSDFIGSAPDIETFQAAAQALGFANAEGGLLTYGRWSNSSGSWFLNVVGEIAEREGFWARLRWNESGLGGRMEQFIAALRAQGITIYEQALIGEVMVWTADGVSQAPGWVGDVGQIL